MEPAEITFYTVLVLGIYFTVSHLMKEKKKESGPKEVWVIEDSDADYEFLSMFCRFNNAYMKRFRNADNLLWKFMFSPPDCVIVDYYLDGNIKGDKVVSLCKLFGIRHRLITGETREIEGVPEEEIIRKQSSREWCDKIQTWFDTEFA